MKTIVIGDIHGCDEPLNTILDRLQPDPESDIIVFLGDLFDRGPDSWEVFQTIQKVAEDFGERFVLLYGNHEDYLIREKELSFMELLVWKRVGRKATVKSFSKNGMKLEDAVPWLSEHLRKFYKSEKFQCVHAGVKIEPVEANDFYTLIHDHSIVMYNLYSGFLTITGHVAVEKPSWFAGDGHKVVPLSYETEYPLPEKGVICIDTGCGKGGNLTAMVIEGDSFKLFSS